MNLRNDDPVCFNQINVGKPENSITLDIKPDNHFMTNSSLTNIFSQKANYIDEVEVETNEQISFSEDVSCINDTSEIDVHDIQYNN